MKGLTGPTLKYPYPILLGLFIIFFQFSFGQNLDGIVFDDNTGEGLVGARVLVKGTTNGALTNSDGQFTLRRLPSQDIELVVTYFGYDTLSYKVKARNKKLRLAMEPSSAYLDEVEITAQRESKMQQELSLTVESINLNTIKNTAEASFYDAMANLRDVDLLTVSFGFKVINTRGFNSSAPIRTLQLIDGFDNASPGLNYPVGNFVGIADLDVEGVDLVIGASSAYFGPGAFNGVINMRSKNPFEYQGLDVEIRGGERQFAQGAFRYASAFGKKRKWAFKINGIYSIIQDWEAEEYGPSRGSFTDSITADNPGGFNAVNVYGDEPSGDFTSLFEQTPVRHPGLGRFYRTGYREDELINYDSYNFKASAGLNHRFGKDWELALSSNFGMGSTVMQLDNRLKLNNVWLIQNKFELTKGDKFFLRGYHSGENAGRTFDIVTTGLIMQNRWRGNSDWIQGYRNHWKDNYVPRVLDLEGFPGFEPPNFIFDFEKAEEVLAANQDSLMAWHQATRLAQDGARFEPGTEEFQEVFDDITSTAISEGGTRFVDRSKLYHLHGEYRFNPGFFDEVVVGGNYRWYRPYSEGTIFSDTSGTTIETYEYGAYLGLEKSLASELLKVEAVVRVDKNKNYDFLVSPALSFDYRMGVNHKLRTSISYALRNPTLIEQYYYFRVGDIFLLGNRFGYKNMVDFDSFQDYLASPSLDTSLWKRFDVRPLVPEKNTTIELAYDGIFMQGRLAVASTLYFSRYRDFIGFNLGLQVPEQTIVLSPRIFRFSANATEITYTTGFSTRLSYQINDWLSWKGNYTWSRLVSDEDDPLIPAFNTPEHKFNVGLGANRMKIGNVRNINWGFDFRWIESYEFVSSPQFSGIIPAQYFLAGQIGKDFPKLKGSFKIAGSNLLNRRQNGLFGAPAIGRFVYANWTFKLR